MRQVVLFCMLSLSASSALAQPEQRAPEPSDPPAVPILPAPTLEEEEPVASPEPLPTPPELEEEQPEVLMHIGPGDHPEWEAEDESEESQLPRDYAYEIPGDARSNQSGGGGSPGAPIDSHDPEEPTPPYVLAAGAGWARFLGPTALDFFRIDERFEVTVPEFATFRIGAAATQMFGDNGYLVGGGVRLGLGVPICDTGDIVCDGQVFVQPGFLAGFTGPRFDLNASLSMRFIFARIVEVAVEGGYSLLFDGLSIVSLSGLVGVVF